MRTSTIKAEKQALSPIADEADDLDLEIADLDEPPEAKQPAPKQGTTAKDSHAQTQKNPKRLSIDTTWQDPMDTLSVPLVEAGATAPAKATNKPRLRLYALSSLISAALLISHTAYLLDDDPYVWVADPVDTYADVPYRAMMDFHAHPHDVVAMGIFVRRGSEQAFNASGRDTSFVNACRAAAGTDCERSVVVTLQPAARKTLPLAIIHHPGKSVVLLLLPAFGMYIAYYRLALALGHAVAAHTATFAYVCLIAVFGVSETGMLACTVASTFLFCALFGIHVMFAFSRSVGKWYRLTSVYRVCVGLFGTQLALLALVEAAAGDRPAHRTGVLLAHMQCAAVVSLSLLHLFVGHVMVLMPGVP